MSSLDSANVVYTITPARVHDEVFLLGPGSGGGSGSSAAVDEMMQQQKQRAMHSPRQHQASSGDFNSPPPAYAGSALRLPVILSPRSSALQASGSPAQPLQPLQPVPPSPSEYSYQSSVLARFPPRTQAAAALLGQSPRITSPRAWTPAAAHIASAPPPLEPSFTAHRRATNLPHPRDRPSYRVDVAVQPGLASQLSPTRRQAQPLPATATAAAVVASRQMPRRKTTRAQLLDSMAALATDDPLSSVARHAVDSPSSSAKPAVHAELEAWLSGRHIQTGSLQLDSSPRYAGAEEKSAYSADAASPRSQLQMHGSSSSALSSSGAFRTPPRTSPRAAQMKHNRFPSSAQSTSSMSSVAAAAGGGGAGDATSGSSDTETPLQRWQREQASHRRAQEEATKREAEARRKESVHALKLRHAREAEEAAEAQRKKEETDRAAAEKVEADRIRAEAEAAKLQAHMSAAAQEHRARRLEEEASLRVAEEKEREKARALALLVASRNPSESGFSAPTTSASLRLIDEGLRHTASNSLILPAEMRAAQESQAAREADAARRADEARKTKEDEVRARAAAKKERELDVHRARLALEAANEEARRAKEQRIFEEQGITFDPAAAAEPPTPTSAGGARRRPAHSRTGSSAIGAPAISGAASSAAVPNMKLPPGRTRSRANSKSMAFSAGAAAEIFNNSSGTAQQPVPVPGAEGSPQMHALAPSVEEAAEDETETVAAWPDGSDAALSSHAANQEADAQELAQP